MVTTLYWNSSNEFGHYYYDKYENQYRVTTYLGGMACLEDNGDIVPFYDHDSDDDPEYDDESDEDY